MQTKYIPLRYCPLEIELELADVTEPIISAPFNGQFTDANTAYIWKLENCMMKVDLCTLDNALDNNYVTHLLSGKSLNIVYNTFISNIQTILSGDTQINVSRYLSKLKSVFLTLERETSLVLELPSTTNSGITSTIRCASIQSLRPQPMSQQMNSNHYNYKSEPL